jgi:hypothetical protein
MQHPRANTSTPTPLDKLQHMVLRQLSPPTPAENSVPTRVDGYIPCAFGETSISAPCLTAVNASLYVVPGILATWQALIVAHVRQSLRGRASPTPLDISRPQGTNISESDCVAPFTFSSRR